MPHLNHLIGMIQVYFAIFNGCSGMIIEEEGNTESHSQIVSGRNQELLCSAGSICTPVSRCEIMFQLMRQSCLQMDKLRGLTCGLKGSEPMVCCPDACPSHRWPGSRTDDSSEECGQPKLFNYWSTRYTGVGSQPWAVQIGFTNKLTNGIDYLCCGSIVSRHVILTAAHCALAKTSTHKISNVKVGEYDTAHNPDCSYGVCAGNCQEIPLNHIIVHPGYDDSTYRHNIALLVLKSPLKFSLSIQPICLYQTVPINFDVTAYRAVLVGWGKLAGQTVESPVQQQLNLPVQPLSLCSSVYETTVPITENQLCAGGESGRDACSGFGGAPLVVVDPFSRNRYYQIGILSFGSDRCGDQGIPSVYTRVTKYVQWIHDNLPKAD